MWEVELTVSPRPYGEHPKWRPYIHFHRKKLKYDPPKQNFQCDAAPHFWLNWWWIHFGITGF